MKMKMLIKSNNQKVDASNDCIRDIKSGGQ